MQPPENTMRSSLLVAPIFAVIFAGCAASHDIDQTPVPVGPLQRTALPLPFLHNVPQEPIGPPFVEMIRQARGGMRVLVFLGTWCSDSRREVPRFLALADSTGMTPNDYTLYALDRKKSSPEGLERQYNIDRVPTFILLRGTKELGRIVETPKTTLEGDFLDILAHPAQ
jgi:hypothetical protein